MRDAIPCALRKQVVCVLLSTNGALVAAKQNTEVSGKENKLHCTQMLGSNCHLSGASTPERKPISLL